MTNLIKANGHNEHTNDGEFYEIVDTTFFYYYNDSAEYVVGDFDEWDDENAVSAAVLAFFENYGADGVEDDVKDLVEEDEDFIAEYGNRVSIDLIIIDSHRYNFPAITVPVDINN